MRVLASAETNGGLASNAIHANVNLLDIVSRLWVCGRVGALALGTTATVKRFGRRAFSAPARAAQADLAGRPTSPKSDEALGRRARAQAAGDGQHHRQVRAGSLMRTPAHGVDEHVLVGAGHARVAVQHASSMARRSRSRPTDRRRGAGPPPSTSA